MNQESVVMACFRRATHDTWRWFRQTLLQRGSVGGRLRGHDEALGDARKIGSNWFSQVAMLVTFTLLTTPCEVAAADLRAAASRGDEKIVAEFIAAKRPLDAKDAQGQTALLLAVAGGHTAVAQALVDAGADINAVAANMDTPWLLAGARGRAQILQHMIPRGPDLSLRNRFGGNALIPACERGHLEAVKVLLTTDIPIDHINNLGWTCLLEIVILSQGGPRDIEVTKLVLEAGADPNLADKEGVTPLAHARKRGMAAIARLIEAKGGK